MAAAVNQMAVNQAASAAAGPMGLRNLGNSCFVNASLQAIFAVPGFRESLAGSDLQPCEAGLKGILEALSRREKDLVPRTVTDVYYSGRQEDAAEFLVNLFDQCLSFTRLTHGIERGKLRCRHCLYSRPTPSVAFRSLQLHLGGAASVQDVLDAYLRQESQVHQLDDWCCFSEGCLQSGRAQDSPMESPEIVAWPQVLQISLKRWRDDGSVDATKVVCNKTLVAGGHHYKLTSLIAHAGVSPLSGHYVAYVKSGPWWRVDDPRTDLAVDNYERFCQGFGEKAYVLFYQKETILDREPNRHPIDLDEDTGGEDPPDRAKPEQDSSRLVTNPIDLDEDMTDDDSDVVIQFDKEGINSGGAIDSGGAANSTSGTSKENPTKRPAERAFAAEPTPNPAKRLKNLKNYTEQERQEICDAIHTSASLKEAIAKMSRSLPGFELKDRNSPRYLSRTTLQNWFHEHALPSSSTGTAKNTTASDQKPSDKLPVVFPVKVELADEEGRDANKKKARYTFWAAHEGFGLCKGSNQLPCCFGPDGKPANAAPNGRCDLCSTDNLEALHDGMPQKITHLLADLEGKPLQHALIRVGIALGPEARAEYSMRRERAVRRRNPGRPKRGPRKPKVPE